jgi:hypothetical protein
VTEVMVAIKAHFDGKAFIPDEPVDLPRDQAVVLHVHTASASAGETGQTAWDVLDELAGTVEAPADWSAEHDHYLYGTPKRSDQAK